MGGEVKNMRRVLLGGLMAVFVIAGCGRASGPQASGSGYMLYEAASSPGSELVAVINTRSHGIERQLPLGTISADRNHLFSISNGTLADIDPQTGATLHSLRLPGSYLLPPATISGLPGGLSQNGRWLVVQRFNDVPNGQPTQTHMMLVDTTYSKPAMPIELPGFYEFDAVSNDGSKVYLIQYAAVSIYRVRVYDVGVGLNPNVVFDKSDGGDAMTGVRLSGVPSPDGRWLFSVYAREHAGPFVHALDLDSGIAFCLDLPGSGYATSDAAMGWSLALNAAGTYLYAANGKLGLVTQIYNPADGIPTIEHTFALGQGAVSAGGLIQDVEAKEMGTGGAVLSADGKTLVMTGAAGLLWVDIYTMQTSRHELDSWFVSSLALSPDGKMLYAVNDSGMIAELPMAGGSGTKFAGAPGQPLALVRVEAAPATP
jgi:hypothetical protein